jgi:DNA polymerase III subunit gamma/tau
MAGDVPDPAPAEAVEPGAPGAPIALYRRYRPATFAEVRGQDHVTEPLRQALRSGRVHHAYLFSGPRGCGKTSSARILARSLTCEQGPTPDPCGKCASCVALAPTGPGSIDVIEIDAASHGGVDDARDLRERAFYAPVSGRFKIYIVDEAHMVTREGFNALLKLFEEPPPHLKFVFATTEPEKVIPTIRSRTHHYPFRLMPPAILRGLLEEILASEGVAYEPAVVPVVIRAGAGSARDALSVLDQLLAGADEAGLTYERAVALLGYTDDSLLDQITDAFAAADGAAVFHAVDRVVEGGHDPRRFAADLLDRFRDLIVLAAVPDAGQTGLLDVPADRLERMREQAGRLGQAQLTRAAETISAGLVEMRGATSPRLLLELMCAQVLLPAPDAAAQALAARLDRLERRIGTGDADAAAPRIAPEAHAPTPVAPAPGSTALDPGSTAPAPGSTAPAPGRTAPVPAPPAEPAARPAPALPADPAISGTGSGAASGTAAQPPAAAAARPAVGGTSAAAAPERPAGPAAAAAGSIQDRWDAILEAVLRERKVAWILLRGASVHSVSEGVLTLNFAREGDAKGFTGGGHDQALGRVLQQMLGISPQIRTVVGAPDSAGSAAGAAPPGRARTSGGSAAGSDWDLPPGADAGAGAGQQHTGSAPDDSRRQADVPQPGSASQGGGTRGGDTRTSGAQAGDARTSGAQTGDTRTSGARAGDTRTSGTQPGSARNGGTQNRGAQRGGAGPGGARSGGALSGGAQQGGGFDADTLTGADLIQRELGGQVIAETGDA